jgi:Divergent InlB B-repeat domain
MRMLRSVPLLRLVGLSLVAVLSLAPGERAEARETVRLSIQVAGDGTVSSTDGSLVCKRRCTVAYRRGKALVLVAKHFENSRFDRWEGDCVGVAERCAIALDRRGSVSATFVRLRARVALLIGGPGSVSSEPSGLGCGASSGACEADFVRGDTIRLIAAPMFGAELYSWGDGCLQTSATTCELVVRPDAVASATFRTGARPSTQQALTVENPGVAHVRSDPPGIDCRPDCSASFPPNAVVRLHGSRVTRWRGACVGLGSVCTVVLDTPMNVAVESPPIGPPPPPPQPQPPRRSYGLEVSVSIPGYGVVTGGGIRCGARTSRPSDCKGLFPGRERVTLRAVPNKKRRFDGWSGFCGGKTLTCQISMITNKWVAARFRSRRGRR